ncbi:hypothetical protein BaRGS_00025708 [Batillaria attramentaria]|uniref:WD repeat-containing protein 89 n=1 Tax=Batillaria attramentaria TaxID=370345 RepID=A0ABD0K7T2_9CAEN
MEVQDLCTCLQKLGLQHKSAVSLEQTETDYVMDIAAQTKGGKDSLVAATSSNHTIRLFSRLSLAETAVLKGHEDVISGIQFLHSDPDLLLSSSHDKTVRIWDPRVSSTKEVQLFKAEGQADCSLLSGGINATDRLICAGTEKVSEDVYLLFWDRRKATLLGCYSESHDDDITQVVWHPVMDRYVLSGSTDGLLNVFDLVHKSEDDALMSTFNTEATVARAGWCGPDGNRYVYCITHMDTWHVWEYSECDSIQQIADIKEQFQGQRKVDYLVDCVQGSAENDRWFLAAGSHTGQLHLLDLASTDQVQIVASLEGGHTDTVRCLHWDQQTETLVTGGEDSLLCLWSPGATGISPVDTKQIYCNNTNTEDKSSTKQKQVNPVHSFLFELKHRDREEKNDETEEGTKMKVQ